MENNSINPETVTKIKMALDEYHSEYDIRTILWLLRDIQDAEENGDDQLLAEAIEYAKDFLKGTAFDPFA